tara:strand:- start:149159 stop:149806 length:648 start_codon:yes stop_codon:yes gene_type:complete
MIIAIDGHAASGKSTVARGVSKHLGFTYLNTGAMYRALTFGIKTQNIDINNDFAVSEFINTTSILFDDKNNILLDGENISNKINTSEISKRVSQISAIPEIRFAMVEQQREIAVSKSCVLEGRDIGTVVFPNAEYKFFLTADPLVRANRRKKELNSLGESVPINQLVDDIVQRDKFDSNRLISPLKKAKDAISIDTSHLSISETISKLIAHIKIK